MRGVTRKYHRGNSGVAYKHFSASLLLYQDIQFLPSICRVLISGHLMALAHRIELMIFVLIETISGVGMKS